MNNSSNNMNVLFLINMMLDCENSGPSVHLMSDIIESCAQRCDNVTVISRSSKLPVNESFAELCQNVGIRHLTVEQEPASKSNTIARYFNDFSFFSRVGKVAKKLPKQDVIFIQSCVNPAAAVWAMRRAMPGARLVYNVQDIYTEAALCRGMVKESSLAYRVVNSLQKYAYRNSDCIITISDDMKKTILSAGAQDDRVFVVHNWAYSDSFVDILDEENDFLTISPRKEGVSRIIYAGNIGGLQDVGTLVEAASLLQDRDDIEVIIVGDGVRINAVRSRANDLGLKNVSFFPRQSQVMAPHVYASADVNVITLAPGVTKAALPSKTAICLACGKPIVLSADYDSEYVRVMVATGNCEACPPSNPALMAEAIKKLVDNFWRYNPDGSRALFNRAFSRDVNSNRYAEIIMVVDNI